MKNITVIYCLILIFLLCACNSLSVGQGKNKVIIKTNQPPCTLEGKKVDPNCKVSDNDLKNQPI
jgi:hypothetical protein